MSGNIGGDLKVVTLQDSSKYDSKQTSGGFSISLCIPPICYGQVVSGSVQYAWDSINHNYQSAVGQSGIFAGDSGFNLIVSGNTLLKGGALATTGNPSESRLKTASLTYEDLSNVQSTKSNSVSVSASYGSGNSLASTLASNAQSNALGNASSLLAAGKRNGSESSQTLAFIQGQVDITGTGDAATDAKSQAAAATLTSRDAATANGALSNSASLKDAEKLNKELQNLKDNVLAAQIVSRTMGDYVSNERGTLRQQMKDAQTQEEKNKFQEDINRLNTAERVANIIIGAVSGQTTAAVTQGLLAEAADELRQETIRNSSLFAGIKDKNGYVLSNMSGESAGINGDETKTGGVRVDLDIICGKKN